MFNLRISYPLNPLIGNMYLIYDSLEELKMMYKRGVKTRESYMCEYVQDFCGKLIFHQEVEFFEWFINRVLCEPVHVAYNNLRRMGLVKELPF